jgi:hypothetical protein
MLSPLARFFRGINIAIGVTTIKDDATPQQQRNFVVAWLCIVTFILFWCVLIVYWFTSS